MDLNDSIKLAVNTMIKFENIKRVKIEGEGPNFVYYKGTIFRNKGWLKMEIRPEFDNREIK